MTEQKPDRAAYAMLFAAPVLMTSNMLAARWVQGSIPPVSLTFWRWMLTLLILVPFAGPRLWRFRAEAVREWKTTLALGTLGMGVCGAPVYIGGITTSATNIGLIYAATPVLIVVFARLFWGEPVVPVKALGTALCLAGVIAVVTKGDPRAVLHLEFTAGDLWIVLAMMGWALYSVLLRYRPSRLPLMARFMAIVIAGVLANLPFYLLEAALGHGTTPDPRTGAVVLFLALVPGLAAFLVYGRLVAQLGAQRTGLLMYLVPLYNAGLAYLLLGETLRPFHLVGVALILPGLWLATRPGRPAPRPPSPPGRTCPPDPRSAPARSAPGGDPAEAEVRAARPADSGSRPGSRRRGGRRARTTSHMARRRKPTGRPFRSNGSPADEGASGGYGFPAGAARRFRHGGGSLP